MAHYTQRKCKTDGGNDDINLKVCATKDGEDSLISCHDSAFTCTDMDDSQNQSMEESCHSDQSMEDRTCSNDSHDQSMEERNLDDKHDQLENNGCTTSGSPAFGCWPLMQGDDNAVDGVSEADSDALEPLHPVCTSTPCPERCQSRLVDSFRPFLSPLEEDSGLGHSLPSFDSPASSSVLAHRFLSRSCSLTPSFSCSQSRVSCRESDGGNDCPQTRSRPPVYPLVLDTPPQMCGQELGPLMTAVSGVVLPHTYSREEEGGVRERMSSTPHGLSSLDMFRLAGQPVVSTPTDVDSPIVGNPPSLMTTPDTVAACASADAMFQDYRAPLPPPPLWDSPLSQLPPGHDDEESRDEAYFTSSGLSVVTSTPSAMGEDSNHSTEPLPDMMQRVLVSFTPSVPKNLVGRMIGVEHVDIILTLHQRDMPACGIITWLRPYLQPSDFIRMCGVSRQWRSICLKDSVIKHYWNLCSRLHSRPENKENRSEAKGRKGSVAERGLTKASGCLGDLQARGPPSPIKHVLSSPKLYEKARKSLRWEELLRHCPLCHSPSRVDGGQEKASCQKSDCSFVFCTRCLEAPHPDRACRTTSCLKQRDPPTSRKSKKNLRRICNL